jgi:glutaredoxin-like YruB-family protein
MVAVNGKNEFDDIIVDGKGWQFFVFYTETSQKSLQAIEELKNFQQTNGSIPVYSINASVVRDIHPDYGITSVPAVLAFKDGKKINLIYGLQNKEFYANVMAETDVLPSHAHDSEKKIPRIVVYSSDGCPWCNKAKEYLKGLKINFREVNVSRNQSEAERLVKRTGQMGTPQLDINGSYVVGFDKKRIDSLLGIRGS